MADSMPIAKPSLAITTVWLGLLSVLIAAIWFIVLIYMPMQKKKFDEFGLQLPSMTKTAFDISMMLYDKWFVALPVMLIVVLGGVVILRHGMDAAKGGTVYAMLMVVLLAGMSGFLIVNMIIPLIKLAEGLAK